MVGLEANPGRTKGKVEFSDYGYTMVDLVIGHPGKHISQILKKHENQGQSLNYYFLNGLVSGKI